MITVPCFNARGFSYVEVLIAIVLIAVCLVPIMEAMPTALLGVSIQEQLGADHAALRSKMEQVLAQPFTDLDAAAAAAGSSTATTAYSDAVPFETSDGRQITRNVFIWPYDGDNADGDGDSFTGTDAGILWVKVQIDDPPLSLETLAIW